EARGPVPAEAADVAQPRRALEPAAWSEVAFPHHANGPLSSPSRLVGLLAERAGQAPAETQEPAEMDEPLTRFEATGRGEGSRAATGIEEEVPGLELSLPGRGRVIGTLVHFAISQDWSPDDHERLADRKSTRLNSSHVKISHAV